MICMRSLIIVLASKDRSDQERLRRSESVGMGAGSMQHTWDEECSMFRSRLDCHLAFVPSFDSSSEQ